MVDHPKTLVGFMEMYPTEEACREALFEHRWKDGFRCPRCGHGVGWYLKGRGLFECARCAYQASVTAGTLFHKSRTDLRKWLIALWMLSSMKKPPSAAELSRQLGVTVKTGWLIRRKISHAMRRGEHELLFRGMVELDESVVGGHEPRTRTTPTRKRLVAVLAEETAQGGLGRARLEIIPDACSKTLYAFAEEHITPGTRVRTDGWRGYECLRRGGYDHERNPQPTPQAAGELLPWVHTVISNFKRWLLDVFHGVSPKHLQAYLDEFCYRLNRRKVRLDLFRRLLNRCLLYTGPITYWELIDA